MPNPTWADVEIDPLLLSGRGYQEPITVNGLPYQRFIGYMVAGLDEMADTLGDNAVTGIASGYRIARGEAALDGAFPTPVDTGLSTIVAALLTLKGTSSPGLGTSVLTYQQSGNNLFVYPWKPTSSSNPTLITSTGTETFSWIAIGT